MQPQPHKVNVVFLRRCLNSTDPADHARRCPECDSLDMRLMEGAPIPNAPPAYGCYDCGHVEML